MHLFSFYFRQTSKLLRLAVQLTSQTAFHGIPPYPIFFDFFDLAVPLHIRMT